ncbi:MAG: tRNA pseudouridine(55) synthase TruB [Bacteroidia bacterium]|nr:tRNA pseudouridine(55) synthase TruB [Bacteroidia bacterium]
MDFQAGQVLLFDKPKEWTSFDIVRKVRNTIKIKKVGHAGTLDPLATGLLILCTGKYTKRINEIQGQEKEYLVDFKIGAVTPCYDAELPEEDHKDASHITEELIEEKMKLFTGDVVQIPPIYSAVKIKGQPAYKAARQGKRLELKPRTIQIYEFSFKGGTGEKDIYRALVRCSKGTYIRTLVHDLGQELGVGAYIRELRRTRIGNYKVEDALDVLDFAEKYKIVKD